MRFFWYFSFAGFLAITATFLVGADRLWAPVDAQEATKSDEKKDVEKKTEEKKKESKVDKIDEDILRRAKLSTDGDELVTFLKKRILPEKDRPVVERLVRNLGSSDYHVREKATLDLIDRGVAAIEVLRSASNPALDFETLRRIERTIKTIHYKDVGPAVAAAAVRVAALHKPSGLVEAMIGYLPFADNEDLLDELRVALTKHALKDGKADPLLLAALSDRAAVRRATAAEALIGADYADHKDALRKLLGDADATVRFRVARALVFAQERDTVPTLIDTIPDLPLNAAWQAEDFLLKLTAGAPAPTVAMGKDKDARAKCAAAWHEWWKKHQAKVDWTKLEEPPKMLGRTLIVLLDQNSVLELGPDNMPLFEVRGVVFPLDAQMIDDGRVLVAEYHANRVTERNARGEVLWTKGNIQGPQVAQRLPNGNTFIATAYKLMEYDKDSNLVLDVNLADDNLQKIMKAMKLDNGEIVCMQADARIVRYDARGTELHSFQIQIGTRLFGGRIHMLPTGRVLVPLNAEGKVVEYDSRGKIIWEVPFEQPIAATRLPNGNTLITSMDPSVGAVEVDRAGVHLWSYQHASNTRVTRAIRR
jgi:HEAT repeat protein